MKYIELSLKEAKVLKDLFYNKEKNLIILDKAILENGDNICLVAEKKKANFKVRLYWANESNIKSSQ